MPESWIAFNQRWGSPQGSRLLRASWRSRGLSTVLNVVAFKPFPGSRGMFGFQDNNETRRTEYPWAFFATDLKPGMCAVDVGGSLSGFQFVLAKSGLKVINVDPGMEAHGKGWPVDQASIARLNRAFGTSVQLENCFLEKANIAPRSVDRVFSISTIEHIPEGEITSLMRRVYEILKPGGKFVATVDLFLNVEPFCRRASNEYGVNISVAALCGAAPFKLVHGDPQELCGFKEFSTDRVLSRLESYCYGSYPALVQTVVIVKPAA